MELRNNLGYTRLLSFKKGGSPSRIPNEKKKELFPYFAYLYSKELNPEKYGSVTSMEEWTNLIQNSKEDIDTITKAASELTDEDWMAVAKQYEQAQSGTQQDVPIVKPETFKKGGSMKKKCSCGCDLVLSKDKGGKLTSKCACNCGGGKLKKKK